MSSNEAPTVHIPRSGVRTSRGMLAIFHHKLHSGILKSTVRFLYLGIYPISGSRLTRLRFSFDVNHCFWFAVACTPSPVPAPFMLGKVFCLGILDLGVCLECQHWSWAYGGGSESARPHANSQRSDTADPVTQTKAWLELRCQMSCQAFWIRPRMGHWEASISRWDGDTIRVVPAKNIYVQVVLRVCISWKEILSDMLWNIARVSPD